MIIPSNIPQKGGGFNDIVDTMLTDLEGRAMPVLQKLLRRFATRR